MTSTIDTGSGTYVRRLIGAAALDRATYEDIESDETATSQAFATVILSGLAGGIGALGFGGTVTGVAFMTTMSVITWGIWAVIMFEIGVNLMPRPETRSDVGELLRTLGFATAPGCVLALGIVPIFTIPVFAVTGVWLLASTTVAVGQALDVESTGRALAVCTVGWLLVIGIAAGVGLVFGPALA
ncbi:MAG: YIP1 family protein [Vicinamibacterales bacterium]